jgi:cytochrome c553
VNETDHDPASSGSSAGTAGESGSSSGSTGFGPGEPVPFGSVGEDGGPFSSCAPAAPVPIFGTPVSCSTPPPPISGGTLVILKDDSKAVVADPDRDAIYIVDLASNTVLFTIALDPGDEPGRLAEDGNGHVHCALRGSGALVSIDPSTGAILGRQTVCPSPRGVGYQSSNDTLWVACATGELVSVPAAGGSGATQHIDRDLRDVVVSGDTVALTQFRAAQVLRLQSGPTGQAVTRTDPLPTGFSEFTSHVAWRAVAGAGGSIVTVHQAESTQSISTKMAGGYGGCGGLMGGGGGVGLFDPDAGAAVLPPLPPSFLLGNAVNSMVTVIGSDGLVTSNIPFTGVLPVDVAVSPDGTQFAAVAAGSGTGNFELPNVFLFDATSEISDFTVGSGAATSVAFLGNDRLLVQTREPSTLYVVPLATADAGNVTKVTIPLSMSSREDTGHDIFHSHAGALLACASCHPEGGDDGHVWLLDGNQRRTPSLRGTIAGTAPYHWPGDEADFHAIVTDVYVTRMSGEQLPAPQESALSAWVNALPAPPAPSWVDPGAVAAGKVIFQRKDVGCTTCHSGPKFTNNSTVDVGTGGAFQVPPLVGVGWRTPLLHDGCAATIADRFGRACSTSLHGNTSSLSATDVTNLSAYLETL